MSYPMCNHTHETLRLKPVQGSNFVSAPGYATISFIRNRFLYMTVVMCSWQETENVLETASGAVEHRIKKVPHEQGLMGANNQI